MTERVATIARDPIVVIMEAVLKADVFVRSILRDHNIATCANLL